MSLTTDPNDPNLHKTKPNGQQESYLVLSDEERAKGFVRPVRRSYRHIGKPLCGHKPPVEQQGLRDAGYVCGQQTGHGGDHGLWTMRSLGCGTVTTMADALCETYARKPSFYGATFCAGCGTHLPVGEFVWTEDGQTVGS